MTTTLITGANRGLGKETARQLVAAGHTVYVGARDEARGREAADEVGARFVQLDVTDDASVAAAFAQIEADGGLDVLVNNAGIGMLALNGPDALRVFDTNAVGIIRVTAASQGVAEGQRKTPTPSAQPTDLSSEPYRAVNYSGNGTPRRGCPYTRRQVYVGRRAGLPPRGGGALRLLI